LKPKKLSRKDLNLKTDEFVELTSDVISTVVEHKNQVYIGIGAVATVIVLVLAGMFFYQKYNERALAEFDVGWGLFNKTDQQGQVVRTRADIDQAGRSFERCFTKYPRSKTAPKALYYYGITQLHLDNKEKALEAFQKFIDKYADDGLAGEVTALLASAYMHAEDYPKALQYFEKQMEYLESSADISLNLLRQGMCQLKMEKYEEARTIFQRISTEYADSPWLTEANDYAMLLPEAKKEAVPAEDVAPPDMPVQAPDQLSSGEASEAAIEPPSSDESSSEVVETHNNTE